MRCVSRWDSRCFSFSIPSDAGVLQLGLLLHLSLPGGQVSSDIFYGFAEVESVLIKPFGQSMHGVEPDVFLFELGFCLVGVAGIEPESAMQLLDSLPG